MEDGGGFRLLNVIACRGEQEKESIGGAAESKFEAGCKGKGNEQREMSVRGFNDVKGTTHFPLRPMLSPIELVNRNAPQVQRRSLDERFEGEWGRCRTWDQTTHEIR